MDMSRMFEDCMSMTLIDLTQFNTKNVKNMNEMFSNCNSLATLDLSNFQTNIKTDVNCMFEGWDKDKTIKTEDQAILNEFQKITH